MRNIIEIIEAQLTFGQKASDWVATNLGSWLFIIIQTVILMAWVIVNVLAWLRHWDPYPFIFMNLLLSLQAAYAAPIIMMSQNRQATRDRLEAASPRPALPNIFLAPTLGNTHANEPAHLQPSRR